MHWIQSIFEARKPVALNNSKFILNERSKKTKTKIMHRTIEGFVIREFDTCFHSLIRCMSII